MARRPISIGPGTVWWPDGPRLAWRDRSHGWRSRDGGLAGGLVVRLAARPRGKGRVGELGGFRGLRAFLPALRRGREE